MDLGLGNARVFVAASSRGLGAATARRFSLEGARVAINGRDAHRLHAAASALRAESGREVFAVPGDVADPGACEAAVHDAAAQLGGLDVVVTNAGGPPSGTFEDVTPAQFQRAFELSVMSAVHIIRAALPYLRASERPAILTITSMTVKQPLDNLILSNSVRMGVIGLTKSLANELGSEGIRVNSILPGWTQTERVTDLMTSRAEANAITVEEAVAQQVATTPLRRMGTPDEFANVAVFLCSPAAGYVHGAMIPVDGGVIQATL